MSTARWRRAVACSTAAFALFPPVGEEPAKPRDGRLRPGSQCPTDVLFLLLARLAQLILGLDPALGRLGPPVVEIKAGFDLTTPRAGEHIDASMVPFQHVGDG
jgi:hypothetical protein